MRTLALSEANLASLKSRASLSSTKLPSNSETKALSAKTTSLREVKSHGEAILGSSITKNKVFKANPKAFQPKRANFQSLRVSVLDRLGPVNTDLRDYLSNKQKLHSEESIHVPPS